MPDQYDFMAPVINNARKNAVVNPEDFKDSDGLLVCGKCGKRKQKLIKVEYRRQCGSFKYSKETPLDVRITAYYSIPKSASKKKAQAMRDRRIRPMKKPDFDNIGKIVCDALNDIAYHDDAQIVDAQVRKFFSDDPKAVVTIQEAE